MDFEQQVNQAIHRDHTARQKKKISLSVGVAIAIAAVLYLLYANQHIRSECRRLQSEIKTATDTLAASQLKNDEVASQLEQARKEIVELNQQNNILSIQAGDLKNQSEKSKSLAEQLLDVGIDLEQADARIKSLTLEVETLRLADSSISKSSTVDSAQTPRSTY